MRFSANRQTIAEGKVLNNASSVTSLNVCWGKLNYQIKTLALSCKTDCVPAIYVIAHLAVAAILNDVNDSKKYSAVNVRPTISL